MKKHIRKSFTKQLDQADCGIACLLSILRYHGGDVSRERLREFSGTSMDGTTLLGLCQSARTLNLTAEGFEADGIDNLQELEGPAILHVVVHKTLLHYVVYYGREGDHHVIGDPGQGIVLLTTEELDLIWQSKTLLAVMPDVGFTLARHNKQTRRAWFYDIIGLDVPLLSIAGGLGVAIAALTLSMSFFVQRLIDDILPKQNIQKLLYGLGFLFLLLLIKNLINYLREKLLLKQGLSFNNRIIEKFFGNVLQLPKVFFDTRKTGDLLARINDVHRIQSTVNFLVGNVAVDAVVVVLTIGVLFKYSWYIGALSLLSFPLFGLLTWYYNQHLIDAQREAMASYAHTESEFIDTISGIEVLKSFRKEAFFAKRTQVVYQQSQQKQFTLGELGNRYRVLAELISVALLVALLGLTALLVVRGHFKLGEMMAIASITSVLVGAMARLSTTNIQLQEANVAFNRMFELQDVPVEPAPPAGVADALRLQSLDCRQLSFRFAGRPLLLRDVSFSIRPGEILGIIGESGSGKSILMQLIQGFYKPEVADCAVVSTLSQEMLILSEIPAATWRDVVGSVPQSVKIFNGTVLANLCLGELTEEAEAVVKFCQLYGFHDFIMKLPQNYMTLVGEGGINLSGGQQQLIGLARALYQRPQLLLLDEITSALDVQTERFVLDLLVRIKPDTAILMITHRSQPVTITDRLYRLTDGILLETATQNYLANA